jgi:anti-sigma28 factor (negative regulator of flagellin synthesis)
MPARIGFLKRKSRQCARASRREAILRRRRIEQLRLRMRRGEYMVSALDIAAAMLNEGVGQELNSG